MTRITPERVGEVDVLHFAPGSSLTSDTANEVVRTVRQLISDPYLVVLDFAGVEALDSAGLAAIVRSYKTIRDHGGELALANVPEGYARNIFGITRLNTIFELHPSVESALTSLAPPPEGQDVRD